MNRKPKWIPILAVLMFYMAVSSCKEGRPVYNTFDDYPVPQDDFPSVQYRTDTTKFAVWAPTALKVRLNLYEMPLGGDALEEIDMVWHPDGVWRMKLEGDHKGKYYTFQASFEDRKWNHEVPGLFAKAVGINGIRGFIFDPAETNPDGWENDKARGLLPENGPIIYELHIRDLSMHPESGIQNKGKYTGLGELGTQNSSGLTTGLDHLKELGITHIHLLPVFDFLSVDETRPQAEMYNWGYDPRNYNVPEGSYSSDPAAPLNRILEFKQMVQSLHKEGFGLIMDVVYNHTGATETSAFNQLVPQYHYRLNPDSTFSNASGCGNEIASEHPVTCKFIVESLKYWADEYHIDGFRFDLMGAMDQETMREIRKVLPEHIFMYGEGWTAGGSPLEEEKRAIKRLTHQLPGIAAFSDDIRDGIKGHWASHEDKGFVSGRDSTEESIKFGVIGSGTHPQIDYAAVNYSDKGWTASPSQAINYAGCHDDLTLWDKLLAANPNASEADRIKMQKLANAIVLTSQGVPFLHAGVEMCRTKGGNSNSYKSPDSVNALDWSRKAAFAEVFAYHQNLIEIRRGHPAFYMKTAQEVADNLNFLDTGHSGLVAFTLNAKAVGDSWQKILVAYNGKPEAQTLEIPEDNWTRILDGNSRDLNSNGKNIRLRGNKVNIPGISALILAVE